MLWIIAQTRPSPDQAGVLEAAKSATWELFVALMVLVAVTVVVMLVLRRHHRRALSALRQRKKPTQLDDLWFQNPIERTRQKKDKTPPPAGR